MIQESEKSRHGQLGGPSSYPGEIGMKSTTILSAFVMTIAAHSPLIGGVTGARRKPETTRARGG